MPTMKYYIVERTQKVKVMTDTASNALLIANAAFEHGQDANGRVLKEHIPDNVSGNTQTHLDTTNVDVSLDR